MVGEWEINIQQLFLREKQLKMKERGEDNRNIMRCSKDLSCYLQAPQRPRV